MDFRLARLTLVLALAGQISGHSLGCSYNGTAYTEGETIKTEEPCLFCVCQKGALACNLKVCADFEGPLTPGCFVVQTSNECCPRLYCEDKHADNNLELLTSLSPDNMSNGCLINGSIYAEGSALASYRVCEYCYCMQSTIKCIKPKCFQPFEGCRAIYTEGSCCPTHYDCKNTTVDASYPGNSSSEFFGCESEGVHYDEGELIKSGNSSMCESCYCTEGEVRCGPTVCSMENFEDCSPVESPNQCCPTGFTCARNISQLNEDSGKLLLETKPTEEIFEVAGTEAFTGNGTGTGTTEVSEEITSTVTETEKSTLNEGLEPEVNSTDIGMTWNSRIAESEGFSRGGLDPLFESTTHEPETMPSFDFYSMKKDSPEVDARKNSHFPSEEERSPQNEFLGNSSQVSEDYDSYDYGEPKLPPSLPNLVIFPFVAADAVTKGDDTRDENILKSNHQGQISSQNDFSPSWIQPEGGFVPKEPEPLKDFYLKRPFPTKDDIRNFEKISNMGASKTETFLGPSFIKSPENQIKRIDVVPEILKPTSGLFAEPFDVAMKTEVAPNLSINSGQYTAKPVTVAYKNVVVDFYPDYLVTSTRNAFKTKQEIDNPEKVLQTTLGDFAFSQKEHYSSRPNLTKNSELIRVEESTTKKSSTYKKTAAGPATDNFFDEFIKPFFSDEPKPVTKPSTKFKYSSKIKAQQSSAPAKSSVKEYHWNTKTELDRGGQNSSTSSQSLFELLFGPDSSVFGSPEAKPSDRSPLVEETTTIKTVEQATSTVDIQGEVETTTKQFLNLQEKKGESESEKSTLGGLLKLAGCNIYGRMYRVGKIIYELSGPCLQCLCTEIGVQCKQLSC